MRTSNRARPRRRAGPVGPEELAVRRQPSLDGAAALVEARHEIAAHQPEPVTVRAGLLLAVDGSDRVLEVDDGGDRRFQQHVAHPGRVARADAVVGIDLDLKVQAVVDQHDRARRPSRAAEADELVGTREPLARTVLEARRQRAVDNRIARDRAV